MSDQLPDLLAELVAALKEWGYVTAADESCPGRHSRSITLTNLATESRPLVRIEEDRGLGSVEIEVRGAWRSPYAIVRAINGETYAARALSHEERLRYTLEALERLPAEDDIQPVVDRLVEYDREYWRRLGVKADALTGARRLDRSASGARPTGRSC